MASSKKRRKLIKVKRERQSPAGQPKRIVDGDRRRRGALPVEDALALKQAMREGLIPPDAQLG